MALSFRRAAESEAETERIGESLGRALRGGDVVLLDGPLGAGKTTLVRGVARGMAVGEGAVSSPTFVVVHEYARAEGARPRPDDPPPTLFHIDAYRLRGADDLETLGWDRVTEALRGEWGGAAVIIEWAERLGETPVARAEPARVRVAATGERSRELRFSLPDSWRGRPGLGELLDRKETSCPVTGRPVPPDSPTYPFADEKARQADLYKWLSGGYRVSRPAQGEDFEQPE